jgi:dihydrofolate reductase
MIVAASENNGIGINNELPWRIKKDMAFFQKQTSSLGITLENSSPNLQNACIMGRKTWNSIPHQFRPLKNRLNIVLTRNVQSTCNDQEDVFFCSSLDEALEKAKRNHAPIAWIIGGAEIYRQALPFVDLLFLTRVTSDKEIECDAFLDIPWDNFTRVSDLEFAKLVSGVDLGMQKEGTMQFEFQLWKRNQ